MDPAPAIVFPYAYMGEGKNRDKDKITALTVEPATTTSAVFNAVIKGSIRVG